MNERKWITIKTQQMASHNVIVRNEMTRCLQKMTQLVNITILQNSLLQAH